MILYVMKDDGNDDTYDMKETEAPLNHRFDPHGSHPGGGRIFRWEYRTFIFSLILFFH